MSLALIGTLLAFVIIIVLVNKKVPLHLSVLIGTILVGFSCSYNPLQLLETMWLALIDQPTTELLSIIALICITSYLLQHFFLLKRAVEALDRLMPSTKLTIMLVPMLIGCLTVAGGAIISAPMVDQLGERLDLTPRKRAAINLLYRHGGHFMFPFVPGIILASQLGGFSGTELAAMMIPIAIALLVLGYFILLRGVASSNSNDAKRDIMKDLGGFVINGSPILTPLVLSIGLGQPFILSLSIGVALAIVLVLYNQRKDAKTFINEDVPPKIKPIDLVLGLYEQRKLLMTAASIMIFRGIIVATDVLRPFISDMQAQGIPLPLLSVLFPFLIGYSTGQISSAIGICWPLLIPAGFVGPVVPLAMLMYCSGYCGYFFSPLHLCTVLTNGYFKVNLSDTYRDLLPVFVPIPICMALLYWFNS